tara:strand:- start:1609 stop:2199 length:591 start_codon:yes stop_codon:yes gene_type:complete
MSIFYLEVAGDFYAMNATTSISRSSDGSLSNSLVEDGNYSSDNYVTRPVTLSFSGLITDISTFSGSKFDKKPKEYLNDLKSAQISKTPITVHYSDIQAPDSNCYFTSFNHKQDNVTGRAGEGLNAFRVSFTLQKVRFAAGARAVAKPSTVVASSVASKSKKSTSTSAVSEAQELTYYQKGIITSARGNARQDNAEL